MRVKEGGNAISGNPPFDSRIRAIHNGASEDAFAEGGSSLYRGRIFTKEPINGAYRQLNFLFNPSGIQWTGNVDTDTIGDSQVMDPLDVGTFMMPMTQTVGFTLLFDRTYETWVYNADIEASRLGVLADIKAFYAMLGIMGDASGTQAAATGTGSTATKGAVDTSSALKNALDLSSMDPSPRSFMQYVQVFVQFGNSMSYQGVISSATVTYTHFTTRMIPNRCSLEIGMQLFPIMATPAPDANASLVPQGGVGAMYPLVTPTPSWTTGGNDFGGILNGTGTGVSGR